jgi:hypothetical protein
LAKVQSTVTPTAQAVVGSMVGSVASSFGVGDGAMIAGESVSNVVDGNGWAGSTCGPGDGAGVLSIGDGGDDGCGSSVATVGDLVGARGMRVVVGNGAAAGGISWGDGIGGDVS